MEKEQTIASMQKQIEELKRKAEQGSQQLQGEVQELELETLLNTKFPREHNRTCPEGRVWRRCIASSHRPSRQSCGTILWGPKEPGAGVMAGLSNSVKTSGQQRQKLP